MEIVRVSDKIKSNVRKTTKKARASRASRRSNRKAPKGLRGVGALGSSGQGYQSLKTEQFATYTPLQTFSVERGSTPGGVRVRGRELIAGITTQNNGTYLVTAYNLQPSNFPRLTSYATIYEMYKFHKVKSIFQSSLATTVSGVSVVSVDYDILSSPPGSVSDQMRNISSSMSNVYADNAAVVEGRLSRLPKYYNNSASQATDTTQAVIFVGTQGTVIAPGTGSTTAGYLVAEYDVEFFTPC